ncbi:ATP-binding protein [Paenibacillus sp. RC84]|uniref:sensor histidine kinase n=1 Tax=Paenibacillus sp. RC84 TaxID=3156252 RepID=UPI0035167E66
MTSNKFRTKARAVELLGRKQIRDDITALIELMKNSYDADAEMVVVDFTLEDESPYLLLYDDGQGMTEQELLEKWLVIGTDSKKKEKSLQRSRKKGRRLMGEKGIGRLASAALGEELVMFTKSLNHNWNVLFLNWNVFENTNLFLDDVSIPTILNETRGELLKQDNINNLVLTQRENLNLPGWFDENGKEYKNNAQLYEIVSEQINNFKLPIDHIDSIIQLLNDIGQGTLIVIKNLRQRWEDVFDPRPEKSDFISESRRNKLGTFVDTFRNAVQEFDVHLYVDNRTIEFNYSFDDELFDIYDLKIKGTIDKGKFYGKIYSPTAEINVLNECNIILEQGIDVTFGIMNWREKDCGTFEVELCHIEMQKKNSSLSEEERAKIDIRLKNSGGIMVFRDGVRVLPYGELENDFLNLERNRSKNAGLYLFSHRNMFGRIMLDSEQNPKLEDKSSREGLLENEQYHYFIKTLQNLLVRIAIEFVSDSRKGSKGLRGTYVSRNNMEFDKKKREAKHIKDEAVAAKKEITRLKKEYKEKNKEFSFQKHSVYDIDFENVPMELKYKMLSEKYKLLKVQFDNKIKNVNDKMVQLQIQINARYSSYIDPDFLEDIYSHNIEVEEYFNRLQKEIKEKYDILENQYKFRLEKWQKSVSNYLEHDFDKYISLNKTRIQYLKDGLSSRLAEIDKIVTETINEKKTELGFLTSIEKIMTEYKEDMIQKERVLHDQLAARIEQANNLLNELSLNVPSELKTSAQEMEKFIALTEQDIQNVFSKNSIRKQFDGLVENQLKAILEEISNKLTYATEENQIIGALSERVATLERENELYSDLANMGMAAEIVNHEFNQLFTNVNDAIKNLRNINGNAEKYWIDQIETGFRAISARHTQLSPMYRSYNLRKRPYKLYDMVEDMLSFFEARINKNKIKVTNSVNPEIKLNLSPSKMYPVFSNLIDNAIYWILNQDEKVILFRFDEYKNAIYIEDSGPGISARITEKIFDPFYTGRPEGRGLGLTIVKKVLESQNHTISVIQDKKVKSLNGACFEIIFNQDDKVGT